jgi:hypothetical protein
MRLRGRPYALSGGSVTVVGRVTPYVAGQVVRIEISSSRRRPSVVHAVVRPARGEGTFKVVFRARRAVGYAVSVRHDQTAEQTAYAATAVVHVVEGRLVGPGSRGLGVALLKQGLRSLGYPAGSGPFWSDKLARELLAFRMANQMARTPTANRQVLQMVFQGRGGFRLRYRGAGRHAEFDWSRQVLALAEGSKVVGVYHASSGKSSTPTVFGRFRFYLKAAGTNAKGMYDSSFFIRGYAVHGYPDVPTYPASHGCIRVSNADAPTIFAWVRVGDPIYVYP